MKNNLKEIHSLLYRNSNKRGNQTIRNGDESMNYCVLEIIDRTPILQIFKIASLAKRIFYQIARDNGYNKQKAERCFNQCRGIFDTDWSLHYMEVPE